MTTNLMAGNPVETDRKYRMRWLTHGVMSAALGLIALEITIVNVALPAIQTDLGASASGLQWIVDSYILVFAGLLLAMGALGDRYGRRLILQIGLGVFAVASLLSAIADSSSMLIAARALMGVGGAMIMPGTLSIIVDVFPIKDRVKAIAVWNGVGGLAIPVGLLLGGWLVQNFSWGSVFLINVPAIAAIFLGSVLLVPESKNPASHRIDFMGAVLSTVALASLVFAIIEGPSEGWASVLVVGGFVLAAASLAAFVWFELRIEHPLLDIRLFRKPMFAWGTVTVAVGFMALLGVIFVLTQYLQIVRGFEPLETGVRFLPIPFGFIMAAVLTPALVSRFGSRSVAVFGLASLAVAAGWLATLDGGSSYAVFGSGGFLLGLGIGMALAPATEMVMRSVPGANAGVGSAMNDTARQVGAALGIGVVGSVLSSVYRSSISDAVAILPEAQRDLASNSIGTAMQVANEIGGEVGRQTLIAAQDSFLDGMTITLTVLAALVGVGAVIVWTRLPGHEREQEMVEAPEAALVAVGAEIAGD